MITHVSALGGNVLGADGEGKALTTLANHCILRKERKNKQNDNEGGM